MVALISGKPGKGKTALATAFAVANMIGGAAEGAVRNCNYLIKDLTSQGFPKLTTPSDHLVYSDYTVHANVDGKVMAKSKEVDGFKVGLFTPHWDTVLIPPYSTLVLDEAQIYYDSKRSSRLPEFVTRFYAMHRHNRYNIYLVSQRVVSIDKSIRSLCDKFIEIVEMYCDYDMFGNVIRTTWECVEFNNTSSAESYNDTKIMDTNGWSAKYIYEGNIFNCYDSHGKFSLFYDGREDAAFENTESKFIRWNGEDIREYNKTHKIVTPDIFLSQKLKTKEEKEEVA